MESVSYENEVLDVEQYLRENKSLVKKCRETHLVLGGFKIQDCGGSELESY